MKDPKDEGQEVKESKKKEPTMRNWEV